MGNGCSTLYLPVVRGHLLGVMTSAMTEQGSFFCNYVAEVAVLPSL